jgi:hypothetical protein
MGDPLRKILATTEAGPSDRKSHPLEGSCQEAIRPPYTTFDNFFPLRSDRHIPPRLVSSDASVFSLLWRRLRCAAPATHQDQGSLTSRVLARRLPLARSVPQKTLGSLPCPSGYISQMSWLPRGSSFSRAHGRGVARLPQSVAGHLSRVETGANQKVWLLTNFSPSLQPQPSFGTASAKGFARIKGHQVAHDVVTGP